MFWWLAGFLIVVGLFAAFGFGGLAGGSPWIAQVFFVLFVVVFVTSLLMAGRARA